MQTNFRGRDFIGDLDFSKEEVETVLDVAWDLKRKRALGESHALLRDKAFDYLAGLGLKEIITTNTVPLPQEKILPNMKVLSVAPMLSEVILRSHQGRSVGALFNE